MSHFVTLMLAPKDSLDVEGTVSMLLAPFDEEITGTVCNGLLVYWKHGASRWD